VEAQEVDRKALVEVELMALGDEEEGFLEVADLLVDLALHYLRVSEDHHWDPHLQAFVAVAALLVWVVHPAVEVEPEEEEAPCSRRDLQRILLQVTVDGWNKSRWLSKNTLWNALLTSFDHKFLCF
jgi:hypothetical protein